MVGSGKKLTKVGRRFYKFTKMLLLHDDSMYILWGYQEILSLKVSLKKSMKSICFIVYLILKSYKINYRIYKLHHLFSGIFKDKKYPWPKIIYYFYTWDIVDSGILQSYWLGPFWLITQETIFPDMGFVHAPS